MLGGVCGGLGTYFDVNPVFYRVGFVVLTLLGGAGILIYGAALLVIPAEGEQDSLAADVLRNHRQRPAALVGLGLVAVAGIALLSHLSFRFHSDTFWALVLVGGALLLWSQRRRPDAAASQPPVTTEPGVAAQPAAPVRRRRNPFLLALGIVGVLVAVAAIAAVAVAGMFLHLGDGVGRRSYQPLTASALRHEYHLGVGDLELDLSRLELPQGTTTIKARLGIGKLHVTVPRGVTVRTKTHVSLGDAILLGHEEDGHNVRTDVGAVEARLVIDGDVGIGQVEVERAVR